MNNFDRTEKSTNFNKMQTFLNGNLFLYSEREKSETDRLKY